MNLDDCWQKTRDAQGNIQPDPATFPSGIPILVDYVHSKGLKFGLYTGIRTYESIVIAYIVHFIFQLEVL